MIVRSSRSLARPLFFASCAALGAFAYACSSDDTTTPPTDAGTTDATVVQVDTGIPPVGNDASTGKDSGAKFDAGGNESSSTVLINEISGGDEWVELVNYGTDPVDLAGYRLADRDKDTGEPKLAEAVMFPSPTSLGSQKYLIVRGGGAGDAGKPCPDGGKSFCFNAAFGISTKNGETLFLVAPDGGTAGKVVYPPNGSGADSTYSRIPSGNPDGGFKTVPPTPGAPNVE